MQFTDSRRFNAALKQQHSSSADMRQPARLAVRKQACTATAQDLKKARSRAFPSLLPPFKQRRTTCQEYETGLWILSQPFTPVPWSKVSVENRMSVLRLNDGGLWVYNALAPTEELLGFLDGIGGPVKHIVIPNNSPEHWLYAPPMASKFPEARVWAPPEFFKGRRLPFPIPGVGVRKMQASSKCAEFGREAPEEWGNEVELAVFITPLLVEGAFLLRRHRALLLADAAFRMDASCKGVSGFDAATARVLGVWKRLGAPFALLFWLWRKEAEAWARKMDSWDYETLIPAHLVGPLKNAKPLISEAFSFLLHD